MSLLDTASLIVTPNGVKEGKLYSVIPSDGSGDLSVTRATTATRVNSQGLVELVPYNLFTWSEMFSDASWLKSQTEISANVTTAPNGTLTADKFIPSANDATHQIRQVGFTSAAYTVSIYAKAAEETIFSLWLRSASVVAVFDLSNGTITSQSGSVTATITSVGDGWYRCTAYDPTPGTTAHIYGRNGGTFAGNGTNGLFIWGAQLVEGTEAKDYFATETRLNIPRLDYSLGICPSILLEPQRTNLALRSQEFDNASWVKVNTSVTANTTASPDGISNADSLVENTATNLHLTYQFFTSTATTYSYSCYIKPDTRTRAYLRTDTSAGTARTLFDLTGAGSVVTLAHTSASITAVGNGWYRATITFTEGTGAANRLIAVEGAIGTSISYTGNGLTAFYLYGAQLEAGAYPTSYIPTTSASVTRNGDVISKTGISSLIGQTEGTLFAEFISTALQSYTQRIINLSDGTTSNAIGVQLTASNQLIFYVENGGINQVVITKTSPAITLGSSVKIAAAYKANDFVFYVNGVQVGTDTSGSVPTTSQIRFTEANGTNPYIGNIKVAAIWKTRISNAELAQYTTL